MMYSICICAELTENYQGELNKNIDTSYQAYLT